MAVANIHEANMSSTSKSQHVTGQKSELQTEENAEENAKQQQMVHILFDWPPVEGRQQM